MRCPPILSRTPYKQLYDALALGRVVVQRDMSWAQKLRCVRFYWNADSLNCLLATPPRSGSRWIELGLALTVDLARGGDGHYTFENDRFYPRSGLARKRLDWRVPTGETEQMYQRATGPAFGPQLHWSTHNSYCRLRSFPARRMQIVVVTRSILSILQSKFIKIAKAPNHPDVTLDDENSFYWDSETDRIIEFYNSWGEVMKWHPSIRHFKYEDLKADPLDLFSEILSFWGHNIPMDCIREGFRLASKKEMLQRMNLSDQDNIRMTSGTQGPHRILSRQRLDWIAERLDRHLIHTFGYDPANDAAYGRNFD